MYLATPLMLVTQLMPDEAEMCKFESLSLNNLLNICMISRTSPSERNSAKIEPSFSWLHWTRADPPMNLKFIGLWCLNLRHARPRASTLCNFRALGQKLPMTARREEIVRGHKQSYTNSATSLPRGSHWKRSFITFVSNDVVNDGSQKPIEYQITSAIPPGFLHLACCHRQSARS